MKQNKGQAPPYRVLNPLGDSSAEVAPDNARASRAPRVDAVDGKTIYLVDVGFGGGYEFLAEMQSWLSRNKPRVSTVLRRKKGNMFLDDPDLWAEIKARGHAVVLGVGG